MKSIIKVISLNLLLFTGGIPLAKAGFTFSPVKLKFQKNQKLSSLNIINRNKTSTTFQFQILKKQVVDGKTTYVKTDEFILSPPRTTIQPNQPQLIRLMLTGDSQNYETGEDAYRLEVREVPDFSQPSENRVQFVTRFSIPVIVNENGEITTSRRQSL